MFRRLAITVVLAAILFCVYANHQLINENEHKVCYLKQNLNYQLDLIINHGKDIKQLNKKLDLSVLKSVGIITNGKGHGSCVAVGQNLILTAKHCVVDLKTGELKKDSWIVINNRKYEIIKRYVSDKYDIALLRIKGRVMPLKLGNMPELLNTVYVVGTPADNAFRNNISKGIIGKLKLSFYIWTDVMVADTVGWWGNSGGPVFDEDSNIIGIHVGSVPYSGGISIIEPVSHIKEALEACSI